MRTSPATLLRIYLGEADKADGRPLYEVLVTRARELHLNGATVLRGPMGFGHTSHLHTAKILRLSHDLPMIVEMVDQRANLERYLDAVAPLLGDALVVLQPVELVSVGGHGEEPGPEGRLKTRGRARSGRRRVRDLTEAVQPLPDRLGRGSARRQEAEQRPPLRAGGRPVALLERVQTEIPAGFGIARIDDGEPVVQGRRRIGHLRPAGHGVDWTEFESRERPEYARRTGREGQCLLVGHDRCLTLAEHGPGPGQPKPALEVVGVGLQALVEANGERPVHRAARGLAHRPEVGQLLERRLESRHRHGAGPNLGYAARREQQGGDDRERALHRPGAC